MLENKCVNATDFEFEGQTHIYKGKVRDVYTIKDKLVMIASDRISAFDHILPRPIPYKGQVLNQIANHFMEATRDIVPNWIEASPDPNVTIGKKCEPIRIEMVIRGYLTGHAWRTYKSGLRTLCGVSLPEGMKEHQAFTHPIITPATKAEEGHDEDISKEEILKQGIVSVSDYEKMEAFTHALFQRGQRMADERGLILVDTKYEFGKIGDQIVLMDEIHTPDSSRYFHKEGYQEKQDQDLPQQHVSKEFVREWLMENGFQGKEGQSMPVMPDEFVWTVSNRYIELYEKITGKVFEKSSEDDVLSRIEGNIKAYFQ